MKMNSGPSVLSVVYGVFLFLEAAFAKKSLPKNLLLCRFLVLRYLCTLTATAIMLVVYV